MNFRVRVMRHAGALIDPPSNVWHDAMLETQQYKTARYLVARHALSAPDKYMFPALHSVQVVRIDSHTIRLRGIENCEGAAVVQEWEVALRV